MIEIIITTLTLVLYPLLMLYIPTKLFIKGESLIRKQQSSKVTNMIFWSIK